MWPLHMLTFKWRSWRGEYLYTLDLFCHVRCWLRYIDDVFLIWDGPREDLDLFHRQLNAIEKDIQFTLTACAEEVQFLDTIVYKKST